MSNNIFLETIFCIKLYECLLIEVKNPSPISTLKN